MQRPDATPIPSDAELRRRGRLRDGKCPECARRLERVEPFKSLLRCPKCRKLWGLARRVR